ncbi:hypothetical protein F2P81_023245 [Scophthalmus maximus]|uniref:Uncharacterized protein n=1 Tax=Scophthalmus maximus TaxID=52904 RepID=A0A6A4RQZ2_SCOMX|nr:hypothetical protein F2P81_023245 [Scophthalmus maximus]
MTASSVALLSAELETESLFTGDEVPLLPYSCPRTSASIGPRVTAEGKFSAPSVKPQAVGGECGVGFRNALTCDCYHRSNHMYLFTGISSSLDMRSVNSDE